MRKLKSFGNDPGYNDPNFEDVLPPDLDAVSATPHYPAGRGIGLFGKSDYGTLPTNEHLIGSKEPYADFTVPDKSFLDDPEVQRLSKNPAFNRLWASLITGPFPSTDDPTLRQGIFSRIRRIVSSRQKPSDRDKHHGR